MQRNEFTAKEKSGKKRRGETAMWGVICGEIRSFVKFSVFLCFMFNCIRLSRFPTKV